MKDSTIIAAIAIAGLAGLGIVFAMMIKPGVKVTGDNASIGNTVYMMQPRDAPPLQFPKRLPHINNGDTANNLTSYIPGGY